VLLVMATGTSKTYTAFQIIHRLWKSDWRANKAKGQKRILFLADRNILIDQTMVNDFRPFKGAMAKLSPNAKGIERVDAQGKVTVEDIDLAVNKSTKEVNKSYEIYLSLYQAVNRLIWFWSGALRFFGQFILAFLWIFSRCNSCHRVARAKFGVRLNKVLSPAFTWPNLPHSKLHFHPSPNNPASSPA
jgi:hypothetical protein